MNTIKAAIACSLLLCATLSFAQYRTNYVQGVTDITSYATSGTNAWKLLPDGAICLQIYPAVDGGVWCLGTDHQAWLYSTQSQTWAAQTELGSNLKAIAVEDYSHIWSLQTTSWCTGYGYSVYVWTGTAWSDTNGCLSQFAVGGDSTIVGVNPSGQLWTLPSGGSWTQIGTNSGWTFAGTADQYSICGINNGQVYQVTDSGMVAASPQPPGTSVGCTLAQGDPVLLIWNTAGTVSLYDFTNNVWDTVAGLAPSQIVSTEKSETFALDAAGHPYHWNVYAAYTYAGITGIESCAGGSCPGGTIHAGTVQAKFTSGINGQAARSNIDPSQNMNINSWDAAPQCDLVYSGLGDPSCIQNTNAEVTCSATGHALLSETGGGTVTTAKSIDYGEWNATRTLGNPTPIGEGYYETNYHCYVDSACAPGTVAVCQNNSYAGWYIAKGSTASSNGAALQCHTGPWSFQSSYVPGEGSVSCILLHRNKHVTIPGQCN